MLLPRLGRIALFTLACGLAPHAFSAVVYNEATMSDLSNSGLTPTIITLASGSNQVFGTTGNSGGVDRDYFTFTIPVGLQLNSIIELPGTVTSGPLGVSFIGIQAGNQVTLPTNTQVANGLLGWTHYGTAANTDLLPAMGVPANGSTGFTGPLRAGSYAVWIQDFNPGPLSYGFDFTVGAVPEPSTYATMLAGLAVLALRLRRQRS